MKIEGINLIIKQNNSRHSVSNDREQAMRSKETTPFTAESTSGSMFCPRFKPLPLQDKIAANTNPFAVHMSRNTKTKSTMLGLDSMAFPSLSPEIKTDGIQKPSIKLSKIVTSISKTPSMPTPQPDSARVENNMSPLANPFAQASTRKEFRPLKSDFIPDSTANFSQESSPFTEIPF